MTKNQAISLSRSDSIRGLSRAQVIECIEVLSGFRLTPAQQRKSLTWLIRELQELVP